MPRPTLPPRLASTSCALRTAALSHRTDSSRSALASSKSRFRKKDHQVAAENANLDQKLQDELLRASRVATGPRDFQAQRLEAKRRRHEKEKEIRAANERLNRRFESACRELNARFRQAEANLHYHNGFIQLASDDTTVVQIEQPFWSLLRSSEWQSVDREMKEAIDLRDTGRPDPAFHAAKALESAIKIISDSRAWTHGGERGAISYLNNLRAQKNGEFIAQWEHDILHKFFSAVRNPSAHGAGSEQPLSLSDEQTDWAIGFCMIWNQEPHSANETDWAELIWSGSVPCRSVLVAPTPAVWPLVIDARRPDTSPTRPSADASARTGPCACRRPRPCF